ncbi:MAG: hypothetical protein ABH845_01480 [Candidatus Omnitrophota bacterium]
MKIGKISLGILAALSIGFAPAAAFAQQAGPDPKETYESFHEALLRLDMQGIRARWLPDETIAENEKALTEKILEMRQTTPPAVMVKEQKIIASDAFLKVVGTYPNGGRSEGTVYLINTADRWRVKREAWGFLELPKPPPAPAGEGVVEGVVTLPPVKQEGSLYVFAVLENQYHPASFAVIPKDQLVWLSIPYRITGLPPGRYWVYAYWDTAPPWMTPEQGDFAAFTGDYAGEFLTPVTIYEKETRSRIDFACNRNLKVKTEENYGTRYSLIDLGVTTDAEGKSVFLLNIRNTDEKPIRNVSLICKINGKNLSFNASTPGVLILPNTVREFDITTCYESYLFFAEKVWPEEGLSKNHLKLEIVSKDNGTRFVKEIDVP